MALRATFRFDETDYPGGAESVPTERRISERRRDEPDRRIAIAFDRDEWNGIAEAIQWQLDTTDEDALEVGEDWLIAIRDRILRAPGVH